jgi:hypothetical protein
MYTHVTILLDLKHVSTLLVQANYYCVNSYPLRFYGLIVCDLSHLEDLSII